MQNIKLFLAHRLAVFIASVACLMPAVGRPASEPALEIQGDFVFAQFPSQRAPIVEKHLFRAELDNCRWRIRTAQSPEDLANATGGYFSYGFDGNFQYRLQSSAPSPENRYPGSDSVALKTGIITAGSRVPFDSSEIAFVWLALSSRCYLETNGFAKSKALWAVPREAELDDTFNFATRVELLEPDSRFVKSVVFLSGGSTIISGGNKVGFPAPYDKGFKKAQYAVQETMRFEGKLFPKQFSFVIFNTQAMATNAEQLDVAWEVHGQLSQVRHLEGKFDFVPETSGKIAVIDARDPSAKSMTFTSSPLDIVPAAWANSYAESERRIDDIKRSLKGPN